MDSLMRGDVGERWRPVDIADGVDAAGGGLAMSIDLDEAVIEGDPDLIEPKPLGISPHPDSDENRVGLDARGFVTFFEGGGYRVAA